ncbi:hypothetical protein [Nocardia sp. NPDC057030]|uniref:hypothetical protein n=1 Tax=unclassified Nocardia TaxID=2637762 RepID=UPI00363BC7DD
MPDRIPELMGALAKTEKAVVKLADTVEVHESTLKRVKIVSAGVMLGLALDLTLTVLVGVGMFGLGHSQQRINELQAQVSADTARNQQAQCAFIALFSQFESRTTRSPNYSDDEKVLQAKAYATLRQIGVDLGCVSK